ncbi:I78 family peptidase inhibitor [Aliiroseovarius subalbicans]|uniref:I78 family peptidase inhibitor n=1 Tax=Aliiroseovarius subalbicans TaxID=2925840 RepID=UPI001F59B8CF|nr:I78 family peptidase inhibitor [Aliiroseovarius subalbicans]MCI2399469.1 I78 family peptidase inhibitor [Aliiroseovarius subalbicans]
MKQIVFPAFVGAIMLGLAACLPTPIQTPTDCGASQLQYLVGKPEVVLQAVQLPTPHRIIHPGDMVTMDLQPSRMNVTINAAGKISKITCG